MRPFLLALAAAILAPAAMSQPRPTPPERLPPVEIVAARLAADGLLPDDLSLDTLFARLQREQPPMPRSALLMLASMRLAEGRVAAGPPQLPSSQDSLVEAALPSTSPAAGILGRLRTAGAISARTHRVASARLAAFDAAMRPARDTLRAALERGDPVVFMNPGLLGMGGPESLAISFATELTEREEELLPERWAPFLGSLVATGHVGPAGRDGVLSSLASGEAADLGSALRLLPRVLVVRPGDLPDDLGAAARAVADTLAARLRRTDVADLRLDALAADVETRPGWDSTSTQWSLVLTAGADGRRYAAESWGHAYTRGGRSSGAPEAYDAATAVAQLFNKALRDRRSEHRLYVARPDAGRLDEGDLAAALAAPDGPEPQRPFVLAVLTDREAAIFQGARRGPDGVLQVGLPGLPGGDDGAAGGSGDDARFTTDRLAADVALLGRLGLVADAVRAQGEARLARAYVSSPLQIIAAFRLTWSTTDLDVSTEYESPFGTLLRNLAGISRGAFGPSDVEEPFDDGRVALAFSLGGRRFAADLHTWETGFDDGFLPLVNRALAETGANGRFLDLEPATDESATYVFLTEAQERALAAVGLLRSEEPPGDESGLGAPP